MSTIRTRTHLAVLPHSFRSWLAHQICRDLHPQPVGRHAAERRARVQPVGPRSRAA